jgi:hypothetical protein
VRTPGRTARGATPRAVRREADDVVGGTAPRPLAHDNDDAAQKDTGRPAAGSPAGARKQ